jgi:hypothetical protein
VGGYFRLNFFGLSAGALYVAVPNGEKTAETLVTDPLLQCILHQLFDRDLLAPGSLFDLQH